MIWRGKWGEQREESGEKREGRNTGERKGEREGRGGDRTQREAGPAEFRLRSNLGRREGGESRTEAEKWALYYQPLSGIPRVTKLT